MQVIAEIEGVHLYEHDIFILKPIEKDMVELMFTLADILTYRTFFHQIFSTRDS